MAVAQMMEPGTGNFANEVLYLVDISCSQVIAQPIAYKQKCSPSITLPIAVDAQPALILTPLTHPHHPQHPILSPPSSTAPNPFTPIILWSISTARAVHAQPVHVNIASLLNVPLSLTILSFH
eukprot:1158284-Pelagomonas_calceolata.AAC.2